jgi:hypothetical protein
VLHSKLFTFLIGEDEIPVAGFLALISSSLGSLTNGSMKEVEGTVARLPDVEMCDFERVCEFAYRRDYTDPRNLCVNLRTSKAK